MRASSLRTALILVSAEGSDCQTMQQACLMPLSACFRRRLCHMDKGSHAHQTYFDGRGCLGDVAMLTIPHFYRLHQQI